MTPSLRRALGGIGRIAAQQYFSRTHGLTLGGLLLALALVLFAVVRGRHGPESYLTFTEGFYFTFVAPLSAFIAGAGAVREAMKPASADYLFTRPIRRPVFLALRYATHLVACEVDFAAAFLVLVAIGAAHAVPGLLAAAPRMLLAQIAGVAACSAFGFFCAAVTSRWIILGLGYAAVFEGAIGHLPLVVNRLSMMRQIRVILESTGEAQLPTLRIAVATAFLVGCSVLFVAVAAAAFGRRELIGDSDDSL
jgi:ABC-type transport system involved in multi-copper enzyme maturation permease subunit